MTRRSFKEASETRRRRLCFRGRYAGRAAPFVLRSHWNYSCARAISLIRGRGMFAAIAFTISMVDLSQFALYYLRAVLTGLAALRVSERVLAALHLEGARL